MDKIAIIDIDNTLWQFSDAFFEELRKINEDFPTPENWTHWWSIWQGYCTEQDFYGAINANRAGMLEFAGDINKFDTYHIVC